jgi:hypothetical protein
MIGIMQPINRAEVKGGGAEDAGRSSAAVSKPDHLLRCGTPLLSARS